MKHTIKQIITAAILFIPGVASAQALGGVKGFLTAVSGLVNQIIGLLFGLAFVYFFWGMGQFILHSGDAKTRGDGKNKMLWGIVALFVMFSIYGLISWLGRIFGVTPGASINIMGGILN